MEVTALGWVSSFHLIDPKVNQLKEALKMNTTQSEIVRICDEIKELLLQKNRKYGDSAINQLPCDVKSTAVEQILVRLDDKLSRISQGAGLIGDDEDVINDIIGYFVLLKIALGRLREDHRG